MIDDDEIILAIEEGQQLKVLGMGDRVVLVSMTPRAKHGHSEQGGAQAFHPVEIVFCLEFSWNSSPLCRGGVHPDKTRGNFLVQSGFRQQIPG